MSTCPVKYSFLLNAYLSPLFIKYVCNHALLIEDLLVLMQSLLT